MNCSSTKSRFIIYNKNTIFEPSYSEETRPRKRARVEDDEEDNPLAGLFRDPQYYDAKSPDACTILVDNTLFRLKKSKFSKVSEVLDELVHSRTQTSDESPLSIVTNPEQFRAFLWAIDASPEQLKQPIEQLSQLERLCNLVKFSLFYNCTSLKSLGLSAILDAVKSDSFVWNCSSATLHLLVETAASAEDTVLVDSVLSGWTRRIQRREVPCIPAILSADAMNIPQLGGPACYAYLLELVEHSTLSEEGVTQFRLDPKLNVTQKARILAGRWSLENYWDRFRNNPLIHLSCGHAKCSATWECRWVAVVRSREILCVSQTDVLGLMVTLRKLLASDEILESISPKCREKALDSLGEASEELYRNLGAHFAAL